MKFKTIETYKVGDIVESMLPPPDGDRYEIISFNKQAKRAIVYDLVNRTMTSTPFEFRKFELIAPTDRRYNQYQHNQNKK